MDAATLFPGLSWLKTYDRTSFKSDLAAGLTVGVMLIPQGMAYAMIAGLPPIYGLYASTAPLILYALLGTSRHLAVGPVAMVSLLTAAGIATLAEAGTAGYITLAITLALLVGIIQLLMGVLRLGFLVNFLSHPIISGFTSAAALIIGFSQLKHLLGVDIARSHHVHEIIIAAVRHADTIHWTTFAIGCSGILLLLGFREVSKTIPAPLILVVLAILAVRIFGLDAHGVAIVGEVPAGIPAFGIPDIDLQNISALFAVALAISFVGFIESIAVAKAVEAKHRSYKVIPNQELIALGIANIGGALFQSYPTTGGFSRTAVNDQVGAKTGMASLISAALVILTLLFLTSLFYYLPKAVLASIIMVAVAGLVNVREARHLWKSDRTDFWLLLVTFLATLGLGIEQGIGIGVVLSIAMVIYRTTRPHVAVLAKVPGMTHYRNISRFQDLEERKDLLILRWDAQLYFANIARFKDVIDGHVGRKGDALRAVILNATSIVTVDSSGMHGLEEVHEHLKRRGIALYFTGVRGPVRDMMQKSAFVTRVGKQYFQMSVQQAVDAYDAERLNRRRQTYYRYALQATHETM